MRTLIRITQFFVGILFIISGLVKANDPLGLSYKMQEFFELWNAELKEGNFFAKQPLISFFDFWHEHALALSILMITLEIVTGLALILGWKKKFMLWFLFVLTAFFTFLTGYAYLSGKFTNCGCFGDCLPITPLTSFVKDIALLAFILFLIAGQKYIQPLVSSKTSKIILASTVALCLFIQWYALNYLPFKDCLPFKKGNNIAEQMKPPKGSVTDSIAMRFIYEKEGKRFEFAPEDLPSDFETYIYIDRIDKLVRKGNAEPRIKGFSLMDTAGQDLAPMVLNEAKSVLVFAMSSENFVKQFDDFRKLETAAKKKNIPLYLATSNPQNFTQLFQKNGMQITVFACDFTVIRTAARTDPTIYLLKQGTIKKKYSENNIDRAAAELDKY